MVMSKVKISHKNEYSGDLFGFSSNWGKPRQWCEDKWGMDGGWWEYHGSGEFWFWRPEDAVFFSLKWP
jgi:hypothetical protein